VRFWEELASPLACHWHAMMHIGPRRRRLVLYHHCGCPKVVTEYREILVQHARRCPRFNTISITCACCVTWGKESAGGLPPGKPSISTPPLQTHHHPPCPHHSICHPHCKAKATLSTAGRPRRPKIPNQPLYPAPLASGLCARSSADVSSRRGAWWASFICCISTYGRWCDAV
jgi:hypothetical protein